MGGGGGVWGVQWVYAIFADPAKTLENQDKSNVKSFCHLSSVTMFIKLFTSLLL